MSESYLPLFRKYRPQSFADLVGQENLVRALTNAIELKRIASAYLFCGPRGTGKTSSARIFAKSLNCEHGPTVTPCQKCASCTDITNAAGIDVIEIDAATNRGVEGAEDLIAQVHYAPVCGKYKIFIIDEVHMLTTAAFNALLKTFEEPPENVIFILATTEPHKVLETIVSRCQRFDFRRITVNDIQKRLREISDIEKIKITDDALLCIAKNVSGGLRDSLALLDQVSILGAKEEITKEMIEELLGKVTFDVLNNLLDLIVGGQTDECLKLIDTIYTKGSEPRNLCENLIEFLRNVVLILNSKNPLEVTKISTLNENDINKILEKNYQSARINTILNDAIEYYKEIKFATNPYLWVELLVIKASSTYPDVVQIPTVQPKPRPAAPKPAELKPSPESKPAAKVEPVAAVEPEPTAEAEPVSAPAPAAEPKVQNNNAPEIWNTIVNAIDSVPAKFFYSGMAKLISIEDNRIILGFINQNVITQAKSDLKHKALIEGEKKAYNSTYTFEFVQLGDNIKPMENAEVKPVIKEEPKPVTKIEQPKTPEKEEAAPKDTLAAAVYSPKVKEMLDAFSGKIID